MAPVGGSKTLRGRLVRAVKRTRKPHVLVQRACVGPGRPLEVISTALLSLEDTEASRRETLPRKYPGFQLGTYCCRSHQALKATTAHRWASPSSWSPHPTLGSSPESQFGSVFCHWQGGGQIGKVADGLYSLPLLQPGCQLAAQLCQPLWPQGARRWAWEAGPQ